jgi:hypothetical protein
MMHFKPAPTEVGSWFLLLEEQLGLPRDFVRSFCSLRTTEVSPGLQDLPGAHALAGSVKLDIQSSDDYGQLQQ